MTAESLATTHAKNDVASSKAAVSSALQDILASFHAPETDPTKDPVYVVTEPVMTTVAKPKVDEYR